MTHLTVWQANLTEQEPGALGLAGYAQCSALLRTQFHFDRVKSLWRGHSRRDGAFLCYPVANPRIFFEDLLLTSIRVVSALSQTGSASSPADHHSAPQSVFSAYSDLRSVARNELGSLSPEQPIKEWNKPRSKAGFALQILSGDLICSALKETMKIWASIASALVAGSQKSARIETDLNLASMSPAPEEYSSLKANARNYSAFNVASIPAAPQEKLPLEAIRQTSSRTISALNFGGCRLHTSSLKANSLTSSQRYTARNSASELGSGSVNSFVYKPVQLTPSRDLSVLRIASMTPAYKGPSSLKADSQTSSRVGSGLISGSGCAQIQQTSSQNLSALSLTSVTPGYKGLSSLLANTRNTSALIENSAPAEISDGKLYSQTSSVTSKETSSQTLSQTSPLTSRETLSLTPRLTSSQSPKALLNVHMPWTLRSAFVVSKTLPDLNAANLANLVANYANLFANFANFKANYANSFANLANLKATFASFRSVTSFLTIKRGSPSLTRLSAKIPPCENLQRASSREII